MSCTASLFYVLCKIPYLDFPPSPVHTVQHILLILSSISYWSCQHFLFLHSNLTLFFMYSISYILHNHLQHFLFILSSFFYITCLASPYLAVHHILSILSRQEAPHYHYPGSPAYYVNDNWFILYNMFYYLTRPSSVYPVQSSISYCQVLSYWQRWAKLI